MKYVKFVILCDLTVLPLPVAALWYFWGMGMIGTVPDAFWCHLCDFVVFGGFESLIVDFGQHLLICASNGKMDYANRSGMSILGW